MKFLKEKIRYFRNIIRSLCEAHLAFIMTLFITYILGVMIVVITNGISSVVTDSYKTVKIVLDFFMPTTFAYSLTNSMTHIMQISPKKKAVCNWFLMALSISFLLSYIIYQLYCNDFIVILLMFIFGGFLLFFNALGYNELINSSKHKHSLSAPDYT